MKNVHLFLIDLQNCFMDHLRPKSMLDSALIPYQNCDWERMILPDGTEFLSALPVPGALADVARIITMIRRLGRKISKITVTFDTHPHRHIGNSPFWRDAKGQRVKGMTPISYAAFRNGTYRPFNPNAVVPNLGGQTVQQIVDTYLKELEAATGGKPHMAWNEHGIPGTWGHNLPGELVLALKEWEELTGKEVHRLTKGSFTYAESFGVFGAMVPNIYAPETQIQAKYIQAMQNDDYIVFGGQARTHCVLTSLDQVVNNFDPAYLEKIYLLEDGMSNIPAAGPGDLDFPALADTFFNGIVARGVKVTDTVSFLS